MFTVEYYVGLIIIGIVAGFASGLLGVGGGFLIVPFQYFLLTYIGVSQDVAMLVSLGTSLAIIIPTAISGAYRHSKKLDGIVEIGIKLGIFGIIGGVFGGFLASNLPSDILKTLFGLLLLFIAVRNLLSKDAGENEAKIDFNLPAIMLTGVSVGFLSGLLGIGGGIFLIVILTMIFGFSLVKSIGISSVFISLTAIGGTISYIISGWNVNPFPYSIGYISIINFLLIASFSVPFAQVGAKFTHKMPEKLLKRIFALVVLYIALKMLFNI